MRRTSTGVRIVLVVQGVLLATFAAVALVVLLPEGGAASVLGVRMNIAHSVVLLVTALLSVLATRRQRAARIWVGLQALAFTLLFVIGSAASAGPAGPTWLALDPAGNFLHLALAIVAATTGLTMATPWLTGAHNRGPAPPAQPTPAPSHGNDISGRNQT